MGEGSDRESVRRSREAGDGVRAGVLFDEQQQSQRNHGGREPTGEPGQ